MTRGRRWSVASLAISVVTGFTAVAAPTRAAAEEVEDDGHYYVTIKTAQDGLVLERQVGSTSVGGGTGTRWLRVCSAPCNESVPGRSAYRLSGEGLRPTETFTIDRSTMIQASLGSRVGNYVGVGLVGAGMSGIVIGLISKMGDKRDNGDLDKALGDVALLGLGLVSVVVGVAVMYANRIDVTVNGHTVGARRGHWNVAGLRLGPQGIMF